MDQTKNAEKVSKADRFLSAAKANPTPRVYAREKDIDKYLHDRADMLREAVAAGNTYLMLARGLRDAFGDVSEKTISRKISALVGTPRGARKGPKKRTVSTSAKPATTTPVKAAAPVEPKAQAKRQPKAEHSAHLRSDEDL